MIRLNRPTRLWGKSTFISDVLIVGSGVTGLTAALRAKYLGLKPLVIEKASKIGGASAYSGGCLWIPNNHLHRAAGIQDNTDEALRYLDNIIQDRGPFTSPTRRKAYVETAPKAIKFLEDLGFKWHASLGYEEYYPDVPGSLSGGRTIEGDTFDLKKLGSWLQHLLRDEYPPAMAMYAQETGPLLAFMTSSENRKVLLRVILKTLKWKLLGREPSNMGRSLIAQLLHLNIQHDIPIWRESPLVNLRTSTSGAVTGATIKHHNSEIDIHAPRGTLLAAGGFAHNAALRSQHHPSPTKTTWTSTPASDTGDAILAGMSLGASTALMSSAWWTPAVLEPTLNHKPLVLIYDRSRPHSIIVDASGSRFMNESQSYVDAVHAMYARHKSVPAAPAWMVVDAQYRRKYALGLLMARTKVPKNYTDSGYLVEADNLAELAGKMGIDAIGLQSTVSRFNSFAHTGVDEDFGRGGNAYDRMFGDPGVGLNPNLGTIEQGPFYAVRIYPGDLGTKGGLVTNEHAQVIKKDGSIIEGLYAAGNTSASIMGSTYPGAGGTLGPALTFGYRAADHMALSAGLPEEDE
ncbi:3-ketosteroid dehydrogenase [Pseudovirgaria hyperparasitica]|uniref:3-ketosteroid dehydrogenase n=1 Tax=Pseudovirgaria hyperparasitica TaxID=470096 RepID=A0A6A6WA27_9PEZI|nr:3-ketosteroid dehydrogenase [Pseudovirgaria hyperparasitica]KAF2759019.1 3-ketosteroid dehydrogenase [Pseudovirgaria hyperparasitica]